MNFSLFLFLLFKLDNENESHGDDESALDFYELTHLAI